MKIDLRWVEKRLLPGMKPLQEKVRGTTVVVSEPLPAVGGLA